MTGEQVFGALISLAIVLLSLMFQRLLKQGDDRHTNAVAALERAIASAKSDADAKIKAADERADERLRHAREIVAGRIDEHGRLIEHLRGAHRGTVNVLSEMRARLERMDAEDQTIRRFARSREWKEHAPREEGRSDD